MTVATTATRRKAPNFVKVFPKGFKTLRDLTDHPIALKLYCFIAEHADYQNSLVAPVNVLAEELQIHERTVRRNLKLLEAKGHAVLIRIGTANAIVLNPEEVWKSLEENRKFCVFNSKVLAKPDKTLKRRISIMLSKQPELPLEQEEE